MGGVIGGVVGLSIIVLGILFCQQRRRSKVSSTAEKPTPFDLTEAGNSGEQFKSLGLGEDEMQEGPAGTSGLAGRLPVKTRLAPSNSSGVLAAPSLDPPSSPSMLSAVSSPSTGMTTLAEPSTRTQRSHVKQVNLPSPEPQTIVHSDSGLRLNSVSRVIELPPVYAAN